MILFQIFKNPIICPDTLQTLWLIFCHPHKSTLTTPSRFQTSSKVLPFWFTRNIGNLVFSWIAVYFLSECTTPCSVRWPLLTNTPNCGNKVHSLPLILYLVKWKNISSSWLKKLYKILWIVNVSFYEKLTFWLFLSKVNLTIVSKCD